MLRSYADTLPCDPQVYYDERLMLVIDVITICTSDVVDMSNFTLFSKENEFLFAPRQYMEFGDYDINIGNEVMAHIVHEIHSGI